MSKNKVSLYPPKAVLLFIIYTLITGTVALKAQTSTSSPYSRFGLGDLQSVGSAQTTGMGGAGCAVQNDSLPMYNINPLNPASYSKIFLTAFDVAGSDLFMLHESIGKATQTNHINFRYLSLGVPVNKWWGLAIGIRPFSNTGYKIADYEILPGSNERVDYLYSGSGDINEAFLGNGFSYKSFSAGFNFCYLFGTTTVSSQSYLFSSTNPFYSSYLQSNTYNNIYFNYGLQYNWRIGNSWAVLFGATANLPTVLNVKQSLYAKDFVLDQQGNEITVDTIAYQGGMKEKITLPPMYTFGIAVKKGKSWLLAFDYRMQDWSGFNAFSQQGLISKSNHVAFGLQYAGGRMSEKLSYIKRVTYRIGGRYDNTYWTFHNNAPITDMAVTIGAGLPLRRQRVGETYNQSALNISIEAGQRGTLENNLLRERYLRLILGFTINERWFIKRKYD